MKFKFLEHTADIKFQAFGKTIEEVFENSALAMFHHIYNEKVMEKKILKFKVKGKDLESLMYNFLEELLFLLETKGFFLNKIKVQIRKEKELVAEIWGGDIKNYRIRYDIKAVTYNEMFVKKIKNKWVSQVVLDV
jgi:SHS2 domain-containing protein